MRKERKSDWCILSTNKKDNSLNHGGKIWDVNRQVVNVSSAMKHNEYSRKIYCCTLQCTIGTFVNNKYRLLTPKMHYKDLCLNKYRLLENGKQASTNPEGYHPAQQGSSWPISSQSLKGGAASDGVPRTTPKTQLVWRVLFSKFFVQGVESNLLIKRNTGIEIGRAKLGIMRFRPKRERMRFKEYFYQDNSQIVKSSQPHGRSQLQIHIVSHVMWLFVFSLL